MSMLIIGSREDSHKLAQALARDGYLVDRVFGEAGIKEITGYINSHRWSEVSVIVLFHNTLPEPEFALRILRKRFDGTIIFFSQLRGSLNEETVLEWGATKWVVDLRYPHHSEEITGIIQSLVPTGTTKKARIVDPIFDPLADSVLDTHPAIKKVDPLPSAPPTQRDFFGLALSVEQGAANVLDVLINHHKKCPGTWLHSSNLLARVRLVERALAVTGPQCLEWFLHLREAINAVSPELGRRCLRHEGGKYRVFPPTTEETAQ